MPEDRIKAAVGEIRQELEERLEELKSQGKLLERSDCRPVQSLILKC